MLSMKCMLRSILNLLLKGRIVSIVICGVHCTAWIWVCYLLLFTLSLLEIVCFYWYCTALVFMLVCLHHVYIYVFVFGQDSQSKQGGYSMHQLQGNKEFGSEKRGYLLKKSDG